MTKEEAYNRIDAIIARHEIDDDYVTITSILDYDALRMGRKALEQEPCEDCISREKARQFLYERLDRLNDDELYDIFSRIIDDMYNELPPVNPQESKTGWIPVSERLPGKGEYGKVLVTYIPSGGTLWTTVIIAHYSDLMGIAKPSFHIGEVGKESFQNITEQVIAWMPLPEPYKAD